MTISRFTDEHEFLSNFYKGPTFMWGDHRWRMIPSIMPAVTAEHAFQASKAISEQDWFRVMESTHPRTAKKIGRAIQCRADWERVKEGVMHEVIRAKFPHGSTLAAKLLATGRETLIEGNTWHDTYWGVCSCMNCTPGANRLGYILMERRKELRYEPA